MRMSRTGNTSATSMIVAPLALPGLRVPTGTSEAPVGFRRLHGARRAQASARVVRNRKGRASAGPGFDAWLGGRGERRVLHDGRKPRDRCPMTHSGLARLQAPGNGAALAVIRGRARSG